MIRLFINGVAATAGGGLTYLRNVIPHLSQRGDVQTTVLLHPAMRAELQSIPNISFIEDSRTSGAFRRFIREQTTLPNLIRKSGAQVLISAGNFALWNAPVPQILLSRNSLYTSAKFLQDVRARRDYAIWADTKIKGWIARHSVTRADVTVAPSRAFADELKVWTGKNVLAIHHGFDRQAFTADPAPLAEAVRVQLDQAKDALRLLFVSHYNYYRNFETLFRSLPILTSLLKQSGTEKKVKLFLTCRLSSEHNPGSYRAEAASSLVNSLRGGDNESSSVVELGSIPYRSLHNVYRACHIFVTPAYAESFAHPLIEAMSSGMPVLASDLPVHREICRDAALYFPSFSPEVLADRVMQIHDSQQLSATLSQNGFARAEDFGWDLHVERLLALAQQLINSAPT